MARGGKQTPEQIVGLLRLIEVGTANGKTAAYALWFAYDPESTSTMTTCIGNQC
jgi:hypothetical protein